MSQLVNKVVTESRRQAILMALSLAARYTQPVTLLRQTVDVIGYVASLDQIIADAAWLQEMGLLELKGDVATLTQRGLDVATGNARTPGVSVPLPGA